ncbi:MAG: hypothetical protein PHE04_01405 [Bacteroidales bacterium]|nr:hypothetical protein [Bacteroidales bacterium]MDD3431417.1 hypothetical protein [Bacteroidales bacterium]MDD4361310.1 hypothetical protein [Bacteroidales bacterium]MDD4430648.1 hypothetical protein [Bacteroidales bacterium]
MKNTILLSLIIVSGLLCSARDIARIDWSKDIEFLAAELPEKHINLFSVKPKADFLAALEAIKTESDSISDLAVAIRLNQVIAGMGDSHTSIHYAGLIDKKAVLPIQLYWFKDGIYVLRTTNENAAILGKKILAVNGLPVQTVIDSLSTLITTDNEASVKSKFPSLIPIIDVLTYFGFADGLAVELQMEDSTGLSSFHKLSPSEVNKENIINVLPDSLPLCYQNQKTFFWDIYQPAQGLYYIQYNVCRSREAEMKYGSPARAAMLPSFEEFESRVFETLNREPVEKLLVDIRFNTGGSSPQGTSFVEKLAPYLNKHPETKLYVVLGRNTFSSAIINAMDFKRLTEAVFLGESTSGKPNHFGEVKSLQLPTSGIVVNYSTKYFKRTKEDLKTLEPDVWLEPTFRDYIRGIDPVYEWVLSR